MDKEAFIILVIPLREKMFRLANRLLKSNAEAEDAVQEVMLKLWLKRNQLEDYRSIEALAVVITNTNWF